MVKGLTKLLAPLLSLFLVSGVFAEQKEQAIKGSNYLISHDKIVQTRSSFLEDGLIKIGVVSDIEGAIDNARNSAKKLRNQNADVVLIAGDNYENEKIRRNPLYPNSKNNLKEMVNGIKPYLEIGVPVFVISGNHEEKTIYNKAMQKLKEEYPNVFDINKKSVDLNGFNIVGMGGYHHPRFTTKNGFLLQDSDYNKAYNMLKQLNNQKEPSIFLTHGPPKSKNLIDYVRGAGHVGDDNTKKIMNSDLDQIINFHGHIHEGGGNSAKYGSGISINVASITDFNNKKGSNTGLLTIGSNGKISYNELR